jgi:hypothetical protein
VVSQDGLRVREVSGEEGNRLLRIVRRSSGSVVTWRRAQMVLLSVQGVDVAGIAKVTFTSPDPVREVLNNFNDDGFDSLYPKYAGGRVGAWADANTCGVGARAYQRVVLESDRVSLHGVALLRFERHRPPQP